MTFTASYWTTIRLFINHRTTVSVYGCRQYKFAYASSFYLLYKYLDETKRILVGWLVTVNRVACCWCSLVLQAEYIASNMLTENMLAREMHNLMIYHSYGKWNI